MIVRVGTVTNVYPAEGRVRVLYQDREETSVKLPLLAFEYKMPKVGAAVVTLHMEGRSSGFVLGEYYGENNPPTDPAQTFVKELGDNTSMKCVGGMLKLISPEIAFQTDAGTITVGQLVTLMNRVTDLENRVSRLEV